MMPRLHVTGLVWGAFVILLVLGARFALSIPVGTTSLTIDEGDSQGYPLIVTPAAGDEGAVPRIPLEAIGVSTELLACETSVAWSGPPATPPTPPPCTPELVTPQPGT